MPLPTSYTEDQICSFMLSELGTIATILDWSVSTPQVRDALWDTLIAYDVATVAAATNMHKLRTLARREAWRAAVKGLTDAYDFSSPDGSSRSRSQMVRQAEARLVEAAQAAKRYDLALALSSLRVHRVSPYGPQSDAERIR